MGNLTTLANMKLTLNIPSANTTKDSLLNLLIGGVSAHIESYLGRSLAIADYIEKIYPSGTQVLQMENWPIHTVAYVKQDAVSLVVDTDYFLYPQYIRCGQIYRGSGWYGASYLRGLTGDSFSREINLEVSYNAGYNLPGDSVQTYPLPLDISMVCQMMVADLYQKISTNNFASNLTGYTEGGISFTWQDASRGDVELFKINGGLPQQFALILNKYRKWVFA